MFTIVEKSQSKMRLRFPVYIDSMLPPGELFWAYLLYSHFLWLPDSTYDKTLRHVIHHFGEPSYGHRLRVRKFVKFGHMPF